MQSSRMRCVLKHSENKRRNKGTERSDIHVHHEKYRGPRTEPWRTPHQQEYALAAYWLHYSGKATWRVEITKNQHCCCCCHGCESSWQFVSMSGGRDLYTVTEYRH